MMRTFFSLALFLVLLIASTSAQVNVDEASRQQLAGTWILNDKKSAQSSMGSKATWTITIEGIEVRIKKTYLRKNGDTVHSLVLFSDNRGETNVVPVGQARDTLTIDSKTNWDKKTLVRKYKSTSVPPLFTFDVTEKYKLSKDGDRLTVEFTNRSNYPDIGGGMPVTFVFDRKK